MLFEVQRVNGTLSPSRKTHCIKRAMGAPTKLGAFFNIPLVHPRGTGDIPKDQFRELPAEFEACMKGRRGQKPIE